MSNIIPLRSADTRPCDTEPGEPAELGLKVPTLRASERTWLDRLVSTFKREESRS